ncbi:MFS transporter [Acetomicrobium sp. UBA5826]|uniref:MFS transporter n=1 Tax=Acetomicrobium sp. UBA5826 TaxID=1946039 RepID=UPI00257F9F02|nr:MFS transporter [Acetomicrobium sp. UBA5826]
MIFATVSVALMLSSISATSIAVAFPIITSYFMVPLTIAGWIISVYQLGFTVTMPIIGKVSDVFSRKSTFIVCLVLFIVSSAMCAVAKNIEMLIFFRLLQAFGGGGFMPSAVGIISEVFPESRQKMIGLFSSIFPIGQIIGPNVGGWLVDSFGWRSVFLINIPIGLFALALSVFLLPAGERKRGSIDFFGAGLLGMSLAMLMLGLTFLGYGSAAQWAWPSFVASLVLAVLLLRHEHKVSDPILDLDILKRKPFVAANLYNLIYGGAVVGVLSLIPMFATANYGMTPSECGLLLTPRSVGMIIASVLTSIYIMKWGYRWPLIIGNTATVVGLYFLGLEPASVLFLYLIMFLLGAGVGVLSPTANNACIELLPERAATITGIRGMFRQMGGALSVTIATLIVQTVGDPSRGFTIVFFGLAIAFIAAMPLIFMMPSRPSIGVEQSECSLKRLKPTAKERVQ